MHIHIHNHIFEPLEISENIRLCVIFFNVQDISFEINICLYRWCYLKLVLAYGRRLLR